jgi:hypothetical protein
MLVTGSHARRRLALAALLVLLGGGAAVVALLGSSDPEGAPIFGIVSGRDLPRDPDASGKLGARVARVGFPIGTPPAEMREVVGAHADLGVRLLLLAELPDGRLPNPREARSVAAWAREFGSGGRFWGERDDGRLAVRAIEFGNETSYPSSGVAHRGGEYAERARDAAAALQAVRGDAPVGLLVQADDAGGGSAWVDAMFEAVPDLGRRVAGWTIHPYGPTYRERIRRLIAQTRAAGAPATVPVFITEWGLATADGDCLEPDNYGWDPCMGFEKAGLTLRQVADAVQRDLGGRLGGFFVYNVRDLAPLGVSDRREHYFGALLLDENPKGEYTEEVRTLLERSAEPSG